jgi:hypothetical protein
MTPVGRPYLSLEDANKLETVRLALKAGDVNFGVEVRSYFRIAAGLRFDANAIVALASDKFDYGFATLDRLPDSR